MRNSTRWAATFLLSVAAGSMATASAAPLASVPPEVTVQATQGQGGVPAAKGRLKFKSAGPICMCAEGLSEKDIEQAMTKSKADKTTGPDSGSSRSQANSQETNLNLGVAK